MLAAARELLQETREVPDIFTPFAQQFSVNMIKAFLGKSASAALKRNQWACGFYAPAYSDLAAARSFRPVAPELLDKLRISSSACCGSPRPCAGPQPETVGEE